MTPQQIADDIERGEFLTKRIACDKAELKDIEKRLEAAALLGPHIPLQDRSREGKQTILRAGERTMPVVFESDVIIGSFPAGGLIHTTLTNILAPDAVKALFKEVHNYERREDDGQKFRVKLAKAVPDEPLRLDVLKVLKAVGKNGITKNKTVISWDRLTPMTHAPA
jgi:hypothetical protein